jgi:NAD(P)-dependent dehydrogenase (short-subunit alcohol dehydrogenase family)
LFAASCECVAPRGKLINLTRTAGDETQIPSKVLLNNVALITINVLNHINEAQGEEPPEGHLSKHLPAQILDLYSQGHVRPLIIAETFSARDIQQCFRFVESREHIGKTLLSLGGSEKLPQPARPLSMRFKHDASYLLVGGLGGLGRGLARWMAEHGAAHFVFMSRNTGAEAHQELFRELESRGCTVSLVRGDVSSLSDVEKAISASPAPPKGIFNLSMVLQDGSLLAMSLADWKAATQPKVQGTWNLHAASRNLDLDFFILFSSMCGIIGMPGQANYSAGNTFMDAFVQYRHDQSLPASVIDVGAVEGIGWTADNTETLQRSKWLEGAIMSQRELFQAVTLAISASDGAKDHDASPVFAEESQVITGFRMTPSLSEAFRGKATFLDRRLAAYSNQDSGTDVNSAGTGTVAAALHAFLTTLPANLDKLDDPATSKFIAREIAAWVFDLLLKPVEDDAELDLTRSFVDIGFDSLAAVELRSWWRATIGFNISVLEIMSFANLAAMGDHAVKGLRAMFESGANKK